MDTRSITKNYHVEYVFLKNDKNLTTKQRLAKDELKLSEVNLKSMEALNMRETFQQIYLANTEKEFIHNLTAWYSWVSNSTLYQLQYKSQCCIILAYNK